MSGRSSPALDKSESPMRAHILPRFLVYICFGISSMQHKGSMALSMGGDVELRWLPEGGATHISLDKSQSAYLLDWREHAKRIIDSQCV